MSEESKEKFYRKREIFREIYFSQKRLRRKMKSRLVITKCEGNIFWQLLL